MIDSDFGGVIIMSKIVCVNALVYLGGTALTERNEASISFDVEIATARPFVASVGQAFTHKAATWKDASVSLSGWYDDADFTLIDTAISGTRQRMLIYPTRDDMAKYWSAYVVINSLEHGITAEDFSELNIEADVDGAPVFVH